MDEELFPRCHQISPPMDALVVSLCCRKTNEKTALEHWQVGAGAGRCARKAGGEGGLVLK